LATEQVSSSVRRSFGNSTYQYSGIIDLVWSLDDSKLYISKYRGFSPLSGGKLFQYDLNNPNEIPMLLHQISETNPHVSKDLRLGPDGKIYWLYVDPQTNETDHLAAIHNPNSTALGCNLDLEGLSIESDLPYTSLFPTMAITQTSTTEPIAVSEGQKHTGTNVLLFPNPVKNELKIRIQSTETLHNLVYKVSNDQGRTVQYDHLELNDRYYIVCNADIPLRNYNIAIFNKHIFEMTKFVTVE
jgi:hypothetical protein